MARQRMCHKPGQHAPPTTEPHAPGEKGTETTRSAAAPVCADPTTTHQTAAAAGMLKLTRCPWPVEGCAMNQVSMRHRRPEQEHTHREMKASKQQGQWPRQQNRLRPHHYASESHRSCCRHVKTHILSMARRRMCHVPGQHAPSTTETHAPGNEGTKSTRSVAAQVHADPTKLHHSAAAAGMSKLTSCPCVP